MAGEVDPVKEIGSENETALEITEETEREIEDVIEKEKESDYVIGTETEGREVDIGDNALLEGSTDCLKIQNLVFFFLCVFTSSKFIFNCLLKVHCVEGFIMTLFVPSMQYNKNWKNSNPPKMHS